jgi:type IV pilus assembly protein PilA
MRNKQKGFSLIELLIVVAIILIIAAIAIPNLLRSKMAANEASAVSSLRTLNTSIVAYSTTYATDPTNLGSMGPVTGGAVPSSTAADLVDNLLGTDPANKSGYTITYTAGSPATGTTAISTYTMIAVPQSTSTGQRQFYTDQSGVIRQTTDGSTPTASSSPIG